MLHVGILSDISELRALQRKVDRADRIDSLTGLPNRKTLENRIHVDQSRPNAGKPFAAVLWVNIVGFKNFNHNYGLKAGDEILTQLARTLEDCVIGLGTVARAAGDEFAIYLPSKSRDEAIEIANEIRQQANRLEIDEVGYIHLELAIGISHTQGRNLPVQDLFSEAAAASEHNEDAASNVNLYRPSYLEVARTRHNLIEAIDSAISNHELYLEYQPQVALPSRRVRGAEALVRWDKGSNERVPPGEWLPVIENTSLMQKVDKWVIRQALRDIREMRHAGLTQRVSINITPDTLSQPDFNIFLKASLLEADLTHNDIMLELTETQLMRDRGSAIANMEALGTAGVHFAIDDFGTGYSSLAYIRDLPVHELKLDRSLVNGVHGKPALESVVRAAIGVAQAFGLDTVSEGIESSADVEFLEKLGANSVQGFYFCRPVDKETLIAYAKSMAQKAE